MNKTFKKIAASIMAISTLAVSMVGMSANAANIVECYDAVSVETIESLSNYDLVMGTATFSFVDYSWQNDSVTFSANISTSSGLAIGTLYCTYDDNVATDKVQGSYYSAYYHYCHTKSEDNNSGFSSTVAPYETAYNSKISYAAGADVTVKGFSET